LLIFAQPVTQRNLQGVGWWWFKILLMFHPENVGKKSNFEEYISGGSTTTEFLQPNHLQVVSYTWVVSMCMHKCIGSLGYYDIVF